MAARPDIQRLSIEDFPELAKTGGDDFERFLRSLSSMLGQTGAALGGTLTFGQNIAAQVKEITVQTRSLWVQATLVNSWVNLGAGYASAAHHVDAAGIVHLRGVILGGTAGTTAFTLPAGARPEANLAFPVVAGSAFNWVQISTDGTVVPRIAAANHSLDGISFRADSATTPVPNSCFPISFTYSLPGGLRPAFVLCRAQDVTNTTPVPVSTSLPAWRESSGSVVLTDVAGLLPNRKYKLTLLIIGG